MNPTALAAFFDTYKLPIISFVVMVALAFALIRLTVAVRASAEKELAQLQYANPTLFLERLQNNRRLTWVFRKSEILLMQLDGQMRLGQDDQIQRLIRILDAQRLLPREKVDYLQKRMSFFASIGEVEEAKDSFVKLATFLRSVKADEVEKYRIILEEGEEIIQVYLEKIPITAKRSRASLPLPQTRSKKASAFTGWRSSRGMPTMKPRLAATWHRPNHSSLAAIMPPSLSKPRKIPAYWQ